MPKERIPRLNKLLKKEVGEILLREIEFPEGSFVTVTNAEVFPDLHYAKIYISVMPESVKNEILSILDRNIFAIQQKLNRRLKMHPVPRIQWFPSDQSKTERLEKLFERIEKED